MDIHTKRGAARAMAAFGALLSYALGGASVFAFYHGKVAEAVGAGVAGLLLYAVIARIGADVLTHDRDAGG